MKVQCLRSDIISTLPQDVIEIILTLMPIRDAVRTSILSRKWRYNWVKIPKLVFDDKLFDGLNVNNKKPERHKFSHAIYQTMLMHEGPLLELTFHRIRGKGFEIDQVLTRSGTLKKFAVWGHYKLPSSLYSLQHLTHLNLNWCYFLPPSTFNGFNMLTSLSLDCVFISIEMLIRFVSGCPKLKHFTLLTYRCNFAFREEYLSSIVRLFKCLNTIEHLDLDLYAIPLSFLGEVPRKLPTALVKLKHLDLSPWCFLCRDLYRCALLLIRSSPNLEKIKINLYKERVDLMKKIDVFLALQDYADIRLDRLAEFEFENFSNSICGLELLKFILVKSPILQRVNLKLSDVKSGKNEIKTLRSFLLTVPRASPVVDIIVQ